MYNKLYSYCIILFLILSVSCSSVEKQPDCINKTALNSTLRWGKMLGGVPTSYKSMNMMGEVTKFESKTNSEVIEFKLDKDTLCNTLEELGSLIIEIQTLNVPAENNLFIEYVNKDRDFFFRAVWDPRYKNDGNEKFNEFYHKLENLNKK